MCTFLIVHISEGWEVGWGYMGIYFIYLQIYLHIPFETKNGDSLKSVFSHTQFNSTAIINGTTTFKNTSIKNHLLPSTLPYSKS